MADTIDPRKGDAAFMSNLWQNSQVRTTADRDLMEGRSTSTTHLRELHELGDYNSNLEVDNQTLVSEVKGLLGKYKKEKKLRKLFQEKSEALERE